VLAAPALSQLHFACQPREMLQRRPKQRGFYSAIISINWN